MTPHEREANRIVRALEKTLAKREKTLVNLYGLVPSPLLFALTKDISDIIKHEYELEEYARKAEAN